VSLNNITSYVGIAMARRATTTRKMNGILVVVAVVRADGGLMALNPLSVEEQFGDVPRSNL
jgi:hypothetical protein